MKTTYFCQSCGVALADNGSEENYCPSCFLKQGLLSSVGTQPPTPVVEGPPPVFGSYELLEEIGRGGMGVVYKARQHSLKRTVAIKLLVSGAYSSESLLRRFQIEAESAASLQHPGIVAIYEFGENDNQPFYAMEYVEGRNLSEVTGGQPLVPARAASYVRITAEAVHYAHTRGILHRDLKPSNVLIDLNDRPRITDFGLAKQMDAKSDVTAVGQMLGSPNYAPPEQAAGKDVGVTSDVYSLGGLLYNLLTGRPPFMAGTVQETLRLVYETDPIPPRTLNPDVPQDLDTICLKCLEKDPARRYATAQALADELHRFLKGEPILARPVSSTERAWRWCRRHPAIASLATLVVFALIASSVLLVRERAARARAVQAEQAESQLRQQADAARKLETKNASRTALDLAGQLLEKGQTDDALAYLVYAAQKDPGNGLIAPRLASVLTSHNFLIPEGAPFQCGSRALAVYYTADGRSIYVGTEDGTFRMVDAASGELKREFRLGKNVRINGWTFASENEAVFGVCFVDKTIGLFDVNSGRPVWPAFQLDEEPAPDSGASFFSPDGRWLCAQGVNCFWIWDAATGKERLKQSFATYHFGPEFTRDGTRLVFVSEDAVTVWSWPEGKPLFDPIPTTRKITPDVRMDPHFSPDGRILAIVDGQEGVNVLDATTGNPLRPIIKNTSGFTGFLPDGQLIARGEKSWDSLDVITGKVTSLPVGPGFSGLEQIANANGKFLLTLSTDGFHRMWEAKTGRLVAEVPLRQLGYSIAAPSRDGAQVVLGTDAGAILRLRVGRGAARPLAFHRFLSNTIHPVPFFDQKPARLLWFKGDHAVTLDITSGREVAGGMTLPPSDPPVLQNPNTYLHIQPALRFFLLQDWTGRRPAEIWEYTGAAIRRIGPLQGDQGAPAGWGYNTTAFSPTGDLVARQKGPHEIGVWNLHTGAPVGPGCSSEGKLIAAYHKKEFSADGKRFAAGTMDGKGVVWDVATGRIVTVLQTRSEAYFQYVCFSPDGTRLLTGDSRCEGRLWNATTGEPYNTTLKNACDVGFSPDGRWLYSIGLLGLRIWDSKNGALVSEISRKWDDPLFSRNGERVAVTNGDDLRVCDVRTGQPLIEPMQLSGQAQHPTDWSPDGRFLQIQTGNTGNISIRILSVPPPLPEGTPIPPWLLQLATICGTERVNEAGQCVDALEIATRIGDVRRQLAALPDDAPYVEWGRWILDDSPTRSISPGFTITPAEADKLEAETEQPASTK